ncbi:hypothetical protein Nepgr_030920 [Nepenthes gracilis]|uniref:Uncharacterized protein n=1 Tax=Nepenthes gracilis TaxID=150966 RepID=A0AAD3TGM9_NEPGR|nr:hypothetical protein Nepgr_030920 [Nepenthes gracilis]
MHRPEQHPAWRSHYHSGRRALARVAKSAEWKGNQSSQLIRETTCQCGKRTTHIVKRTPAWTAKTPTTYQTGDAS